MRPSPPDPLSQPWEKPSPPGPPPRGYPARSAGEGENVVGGASVTIAVIDYGAGNLRSIRRALEAAGAEVAVTADPEVVANADAVVLPGVGAAGAAMARLRALGLVPVVEEAVADGKPFLGICLGMQLLYGPQEEGDTTGLGLLPGRVRGLRGAVKVPHMGWNRSRIIRAGPLGAPGEERDYYFVHSYVVEPEDAAAVAAEVTYGETFPSVVIQGNVWGTQFHPEKSAADGLALVRAFVTIVGARHASATQAATTEGSTAAREAVPA